MTCRDVGEGVRWKWGSDVWYVGMYNQGQHS